MLKKFGELEVNAYLCNPNSEIHHLRVGNMV